ncbi:hypothetical protein QOT17_006851 [Balamuthia mandrillaris]
MAGVRARLLSISRSKSPFYDVDERETGFNERDEQQLRMFSSAAAPSKADGSASETAPLLPHPKRWKNLGTQEFMQYYDRTRSRRMFFRAVLFRDIAIFINVLIGLGLMFCLLELDHRHHVMVNNSRAAKGIEIALSVSTFILIVQTLEYHRLILHTKIRELKRAKNKKIKKKSYIPIIKKKAPIWWTVWVNSSLRYKIFIELIFIIPHPILGFPIWLIKFTSIYMFLRLYVVCRIARDLNPMWRNAALIRRIPGYSTSPVPNVTTMRSLVIYFYQYPILITLITGALICMWSGYGIYVYERDYSDTCDYKTALFLATTSMLTAWPADVFGIYTPGTAGGRSLAIIASVLGLFVFAFLVDHFHSNLRPSQFEVGVVDWVERLKLEDQERVEAAKLVQMVWRRYLQMKRKGKTFFWKKSFRVDFNKQVALLRHIRAFVYFLLAFSPLFAVYEYG